MPKRKPPRPKLKGDHGPETAAQRLGAVLERVPEDANGMGRKRRKAAIDAFPGLSERQRKAGQAIHEAYAATQKAPDAIKAIQVDSSPKPDAAIAIQVDRASKLSRLMGFVPSDMRKVVWAVCCDNMTIRGITTSSRPRGMLSAQLKVALDIVANRLGY